MFKKKFKKPICKHKWSVINGRATPYETEIFLICEKCEKEYIKIVKTSIINIEVLVALAELKNWTVHPKCHLGLFQ